MNTVIETPTAALARVVQPLEQSKAAIVKKQFAGMFDAVERWQSAAKALVVTHEDQTMTMKTARALRLEIKAARVELDKRRKAMKEGILLEGRAIDGAYNVFVSLSDPLEKHLLDQETFGERAAKARSDALQAARSAALQALGVSPLAMPAELGALTEAEWEMILGEAREAKAAREEKARLAEEARVEAAKIVAQREAEARAQRLKDDAERKAREEETRKENERLRAELAARLIPRSGPTDLEQSMAGTGDYIARTMLARSLPVPDGREQGHPESAATTPVMGIATEEAAASHVGAPGLVQQGIPSKEDCREGPERRGHYQEPQAEYGAGGDSRRDGVVLSGPPTRAKYLVLLKAIRFYAKATSSNWIADDCGNLARKALSAIGET